MDYEEAIDYLLSLSDLERGYQASPNPVMNLETMRSLLARLNDPQQGRGTVHVTGSKGKGSVSAMIAGVLRQAGLSTGLFTSPHLHSFTERINIGGDPVSPREFAAGLEAIRDTIDAERGGVHGDVSTFGALVALFFWLVRAQVPRVDWQVVEVGLGGTFDATNVIGPPEVAVITPISLEHTAILGNTVAEIARDKAGIIKHGTTAVVAPQRDAGVIEVVRAHCDEVGAELVDVAALYEVVPGEKHPYGQACRLIGPRGERLMRTPMLGHHQLENAATAVAAAEAIRARKALVPEHAIVDGIARTRVPGRMEVMAQGPLIVADGAHNGESAEALARSLRDYFEWKRCMVVLGCTRDKDVAGIGRALGSVADLVICAQFRNARSMDPQQIAAKLGEVGVAATDEGSVPTAIDLALSQAEAGDLICITGSLYVVAEAREYLLGESVIRR